MLLTSIGGLWGCQRNPQASDFTPSEETATNALTASLDAWKNGDASSVVTGRQPAVETADGLRTKGRTLTKYEVLGFVPANAPRCLAVKLTLGNPAQELRERYVVVGIDPIWVMRYDDYLMVMHWDHAMAEPTRKSPPAKR
ncbi:MAG: hypothetical protein U0798_11765 [Gemmataceae bacterium]